MATDMPPANSKGVPHMYTKDVPGPEAAELKRTLDEARARTTAQQDFPIFNPMGKC